MEFLIGKLLSNNLISLGIYEELSDILKKNGKNLADIEEAEPEPSLGNGGLDNTTCPSLIKIFPKCKSLCIIPAS